MGSGAESGAIGESGKAKARCLRLSGRYGATAGLCGEPGLESTHQFAGFLIVQGVYIDCSEPGRGCRVGRVGDHRDIKQLDLRDVALSVVGGPLLADDLEG